LGHLGKISGFSDWNQACFGTFWVCTGTGWLELTLPEKLAWMVAFEFMLDVAIRFKLGHRATEWIIDWFKLCSLGILPPGLNWFSIHLVVRHPIFNQWLHPM
jgi:hypothetical protein